MVLERHVKLQAHFLRTNLDLKGDLLGGRTALRSRNRSIHNDSGKHICLHITPCTKDAKDLLPFACERPKQNHRPMVTSETFLTQRDVAAEVNKSID